MPSAGRDNDDGVLAEFAALNIQGKCRQEAGRRQRQEAIRQCLPISIGDGGWLLLNASVENHYIPCLFHRDLVSEADIDGPDGKGCDI